MNSYGWNCSQTCDCVNGVCNPVQGTSLIQFDQLIFKAITQKIEFIQSSYINADVQFKQSIYEHWRLEEPLKGLHWLCVIEVKGQWKSIQLPINSLTTSQMFGTIRVGLFPKYYIKDECMFIYLNKEHVHQCTMCIRYMSIERTIYKYHYLLILYTYNSYQVVTVPVDGREYTVKQIQTSVCNVYLIVQETILDVTIPWVVQNVFVQIITSGTQLQNCVKVKLVSHKACQ